MQASSGEITVRVASSGHAQGFRNIAFSFLADATDLTRATALANAIQQKYKAHQRAGPCEKAKGVFSFWVDNCIRWPDRFNLNPTDPCELENMVEELRALWFRAFTPGHGANLLSRNEYWDEFIHVMQFLSMKGLMPPSEYDGLDGNPEWRSRTFKTSEKTLIDPERAAGVMPDLDEDFNKNLLEPISLSLKDEDYLTEYQARTQRAIDMHYACAAKDMDRFKQLAREGRELIARTDYAAMLAHMRNPDTLITKRHIDPVTNRHFFTDAHDNQLGNLLAMVKHEMDGIPKPYMTKAGNGASVVQGENRWTYMQKYGLPRLMPYLGLLTYESIIPLLVIILIDHPNLNVESIIKTDLLDEYGNLKALSTAGDGGKAVRFTVAKTRANDEKSAILTGRSLAAMRLIIKGTAPYRRALRKQGDPAYRRLLLVLDQYKIVPFAPGRANENYSQPTRGKGVGKFQRNPFMLRHPELKEWLQRSTLAGLRVTAGVLEWLKSDGDLDYTAKVFGHSNVRTAIKNYIPKPLQDAIYERTIRRFHNLLICAACAGEPYMFAATDFNNIDELHTFLADILSNTEKRPRNDLIEHIREAISKACSLQEGNIPPPSSTSANPPASLIEGRKAIWNLSVDGLAVIRLYREHILASELSQAELDFIDSTTGASPRLYLAFGNVIAAFDKDGLPKEHVEYEPLFKASIERANELRSKITFPDLKLAMEA